MIYRTFQQQTNGQQVHVGRHNCILHHPVAALRTQLIPQRDSQRIQIPGLSNSDCSNHCVYVKRAHKLDFKCTCRLMFTCFRLANFKSLLLEKRLKLRASTARYCTVFDRHLLQYCIPNRPCKVLIEGQVMT